MKTNNESLNGFANRNGESQEPSFAEFGFRRFSAECSQKLADLKDRVVSDLTTQFGALNSRLVRQVVNEADSLAATTPFPSLFLPVLAEEKVRAASNWTARQQMIREQTLMLAA
jgi:hypothetical protein